MIAIILIGQTGAGKTTVARKVAKFLEMPLISSGDIARKMSEADKEAKNALDQGEWAPELAMRAEIIAQIEGLAATNGDFVMEGFPRRLEQLYIVESIPGIKPLYFVIECDPLICIRRLVARDRPGDHPDAVATRFRAYDEYTEPMVAYLSNHVHYLDGSLELDPLADLIVGWYDTQRNAQNGR